MPPDGQPWEFPDNGQRLFAIGDIHGEFNGLIEILHHIGLIDQNGHWSGGRNRLIFTGDLVDRGPDTRIVMDFLMRLEKEAEAQGGILQTLIGNHDVMATKGEVLFATKRDQAAFQEFTNPENEEARDTKYGVRAAYKGETQYARWIRTRNTIAKVGRTLFVHAGLENSIFQSSPEQINATMRAWLRYY